MPEVQSDVTIPGVVVQLPCGVIQGGATHRDAEIIPMTGYIRKTLAREDVRTNPAKMTDVILQQCVRRIGPIQPLNHEVLAEMLLGDRDFLLLQIRRISMGRDIKSRVECGGCKKKVEVTFDVDEFSPRPMSATVETRDGVRVFHVTSASPKFSAVCRYPKGDDQQIIIQHINRNPVEATFRLYAACLVEWDGALGPFDFTHFEGLPLSTLDKFEEEYSRNMAGPSLRQSVACPSCGSEIVFAFQGSDFLFRPPRV